MWSVGNADFRNIIAPGVVYGTVPAETREIRAPRPLIRGTAYRVFVAFALASWGDDLAGETVFTP